jgi:hypothetical protein
VVRCGETIQDAAKEDSDSAAILQEKGVTAYDDDAIIAPAIVEQLHSGRHAESSCRLALAQNDVNDMWRYLTGRYSLGRLSEETCRMRQPWEDIKNRASMSSGINGC